MQPCAQFPTRNCSIGSTDGAVLHRPKVHRTIQSAKRPSPCRVEQRQIRKSANKAFHIIFPRCGLFALRKRKPAIWRHFAELQQFLKYCFCWCIDFQLAYVTKRSLVKKPVCSMGFLVYRKNGWNAKLCGLQCCRAHSNKDIVLRYGSVKFGQRQRTAEFCSCFWKLI